MKKISSIVYCLLLIFLLTIVENFCLKLVRLLIFLLMSICKINLAMLLPNIRVVIVYSSSTGIGFCLLYSSQKSLGA